MSKNFELMRRAGNGFDRDRPLQLDLQPEHSPSQFALASPSSTEEKSSDWLRAIAVLRKHWQLSAFFAFAVLVTVIFVTFLIQPMYQATARIEIDPAGVPRYWLSCPCPLLSPLRGTRQGKSGRCWAGLDEVGSTAP